MSSIRAEHTRNYVVLSKICLEDIRLSWEAKGLWAYLLSRPDNWHVSVAHLTKHFLAKETKIYRILGELIKYGYCRKEQLRKNGSFKTCEYVILEQATEVNPIQIISPQPENPGPANAGPANQGLVSNELKYVRKVVSTEPAAAPTTTVSAKTRTQEFNDLLGKYKLAEDVLDRYETVSISDLKKHVQAFERYCKKREDQGNPVNNKLRMLDRAIKERWISAASKEDIENAAKQKEELLRDGILDNRDHAFLVYELAFDHFTQENSFKVCDRYVQIKVGKGFSNLAFNDANFKETLYYYMTNTYPREFLQFYPR